MDLRLLLASCAGLAAGAAAVIACTTAPAPKSDLTTRPDTKHKNDAAPDDTLGDDDESDQPLPDGGKPPGRIYAHTATALYLFDPLVQTLKKIGDFDGLDPTLPGDERMLDIALDSDSAMYGTTDHGFVRIDPTSAKVTYITKNTASFGFPNALSFVPVGTVDPTKEALVGYLQKDDAFGPTTYVRIDLTTGDLSEIGELNPPGAAQTWRSSGDLIATFRGGNKAFLTVKLFNVDGGALENDPGTDSLAEVDPKTGQLLRIIGNIGQANFFGLGQWAGTSYGFNELGNIVKIDMETGVGTTILMLKEDGGTGSWYGAGMTTAAPTAP